MKSFISLENQSEPILEKIMLQILEQKVREQYEWYYNVKLCPRPLVGSW